jgi:hypothetical protein
MIFVFPAKKTFQHEIFSDCKDNFINYNTKKRFFGRLGKGNDKQVGKSPEKLGSKVDFDINGVELYVFVRCDRLY